MKNVGKETLRVWLGREDLFLIDVRSLGAFDKSIAKIEKAHRIDPDRFSNLAKDIPKNKKVVLYCEDGKTECPTLARQLGRLGCREVYVLKGGFQAWSGKDYLTVPKELKY